MKILLVAINAKYIHTNPAVLSLKTYARRYQNSIETAEYTINNYEDIILGDIYQRKPDWIGFSCYIWNISMVKELAVEIKKVLPDTKIWLGGPEVSYHAGELLETEHYADGIILGEGEATFLELMEYFHGEKESLEDIKGIAYKENSQIRVNSKREPINLDDIPFIYEDIGQFKNKIIYYESSRGCPYSCSYCLSSADKNVRFRNTSLVKKELAIFLEHKVPQVKFVDRTFNCNREHALSIWRFIKERDNGITNFHFEISADLLTEEEIKLISTFRKGLIQLEIGVQSTNQKTIAAIQRNMDFSKLSQVVRKIYEPRNIHQHLDLIAGLPYEDYSSFRRSFNDVYALKPDQLQLGFLKVLKGSSMMADSEKYHICFKDKAPYEVLYTDWLSFDEVLALKKVEEMVEVYYNSGQFVHSILYMSGFHETPFDLYQAVGDYYEKKDLKNISHSRMKRYQILLDYFEENIDKNSEVFQEILIYDLYLREKLKSRPPFAKEDSEYREQWKSIAEIKTSRQNHVEHFNFNIEETIKQKMAVRKSNFIVFDYEHRNPLNHEAGTIYLEVP